MSNIAGPLSFCSPVSSRAFRPVVGAALLALGALAGSVGCVVQNSAAVAAGGTATIDAPFDVVFPGISCTPGGQGGIASWEISVTAIGGVAETSSYSSGQVTCFDSTQPDDVYDVQFQNLQPSTTYSFESTGYIVDDTGAASQIACYSTTCSATTGPADEIVTVACSAIQQSSACQ